MTPQCLSLIVLRCSLLALLILATPLSGVAAPNNGPPQLSPEPPEPIDQQSPGPNFIPILASHDNDDGGYDDYEIVNADFGGDINPDDLDENSTEKYAFLEFEERVDDLPFGSVIARSFDPSRLIQIANQNSSEPWYKDPLTRVFDVSRTNPDASDVTDHYQRWITTREDTQKEVLARDSRHDFIYKEANPKVTYEDNTTSTGLITPFGKQSQESTYSLRTIYRDVFGSWGSHLGNASYSHISEYTAQTEQTGFLDYAHVTQVGAPNEIHIRDNALFPVDDDIHANPDNPAQEPPHSSQLPSLLPSSGTYYQYSDYLIRNATVRYDNLEEPEEYDSPKERLEYLFNGACELTEQHPGGYSRYQAKYDCTREVVTSHRVVNQGLKLTVPTDDGALTNTYIVNDTAQAAINYEIPKPATDLSVNPSRVETVVTTNSNATVELNISRIEATFELRDDSFHLTSDFVYNETVQEEVDTLDTHYYLPEDALEAKQIRYNEPNTDSAVVLSIGLSDKYTDQNGTAFPNDLSNINRLIASLWTRGHFGDEDSVSQTVENVWGAYSLAEDGGGKMVSYDDVTDADDTRLPMQYLIHHETEPFEIGLSAITETLRQHRVATNRPYIHENSTFVIPDTAASYSSISYVNPAGGELGVLKDILGHEIPITTESIKVTGTSLQTTVNGNRVTLTLLDEDNTPLSNRTVEVMGGDVTSVTTDRNGQATVTATAPDVEFIFRGYSPSTLNPDPPLYDQTSTTTSVERSSSGGSGWIDILLRGERNFLGNISTYAGFFGVLMLFYFTIRYIKG